MNLGEWVRKGRTQALETINTNKSSFQMECGSSTIDKRGQYACLGNEIIFELHFDILGVLFQIHYKWTIHIKTKEEQIKMCHGCAGRHTA